MRTVWAQQWGVHPDTGRDSTQLFARMLQQNPANVHIVLQAGRYDFFAEQAEKKEYYLSNSDVVNPRRLSIQLSHMENVVLDGGGAELIFHGQTMPFTVDRSCQVTIKDLTIDWDIPLTAEGRVLRAEKKYIDLAIDPVLYPHEVGGGRLWFTGDGWREPLWDWGHTEFSAQTGKVAFGRGDTFPPTTQRRLTGGAIRFYGEFQAIPQPGNFIVLRHGQRIHAGIFIQDSADVTVEDVTIHATGGLGILVQFSKNLRFSRIRMLPNRAKGRRFASGHDDGIHLSANSGTVTVEECSFLGLMDDPLNLHGVAAQLETRMDDQTVRGRFMHCQSKGFPQWALPGHTVAFLEAGDMHEIARRQVKSFELQTPEHFLMRLEKPLPKTVGAGASLENLSRTAALVCRNNYFGSCRARSVLFSTPQPVLVENNVFESAGAAILIAGDASTWYESGSCRDVTIRNNFFADCCLTSEYLGGEGIISIHPELPRPRAEFPCHQNVSIENNVFQTADARVLYALCTSGLRFCGNRVLRSYTYPTRCPLKKRVTLEHCTDVTMRGNIFVGDVAGTWDEKGE